MAIQKRKILYHQTNIDVGEILTFSILFAALMSPQTRRNFSADNTYFPGFGVVVIMIPSVIVAVFPVLVAIVHLVALNLGHFLCTCRGPKLCFYFFTTRIATVLL